MRANASVDVYFGAYDTPIDSDSCAGGEGIVSSYVCVSMPGSSWSSGRNELARAVFKRNSVGYKYWIFVDEDAKDVACLYCEAAADIPSCCYDAYVRYLLLDAVQHATVGLFAWQTPKKAVAAHRRMLPNGTLATLPAAEYRGPPYGQLFWDCIDARIVAFHADALPLFLPYFTQLENVSWHESQALQFYFSIGCVPGATIVLGGFTAPNTARDKSYPRGRVPTSQELAVLQQAVPTLYPILPVPRHREVGFAQGNCGNRTAVGWQSLDYVYGSHSDSGWWRQSVRFQLCVEGGMRDRFLEFMRGPSPYLDSGSSSG